jgi:hypothetical protein
MQTIFVFISFETAIYLFCWTFNAGIKSLCARLPAEIFYYFLISRSAIKGQYRKRQSDLKEQTEMAPSYITKDSPRLLNMGIYSEKKLLQWTFELRTAWHTNNLSYDQNFSFDFYDLYAGQGHVRYDPHGVRKLQSEPRYVCLWT